jgi:hypothetical protein
MRSAIPRDFDLPADRLAARRAHLLTTIQCGPRKHWRVASSHGSRLRPVLAGVAGVLVCLSLVPIGDASLARRAIAGINDALGRAEAARDALPDTSVMSVFRRSATATDVPPASARGVLRRIHGAPVNPAVNPGAAIYTQSRLALTGAGPLGASLYLVPTDKDTLCMVWVPDIGGGCTQGFMSGTDVIYSRGLVNSGPQIWGIYRDDVASVSGVFDGDVRPLTNGESAFYYSGAALPSALILNLANGSTETVQVGAPAPRLHSS